MTYFSIDGGKWKLVSSPPTEKELQKLTLAELLHYTSNKNIGIKKAIIETIMNKNGCK